MTNASSQQAITNEIDKIQDKFITVFCLLAIVTAPIIIGLLILINTPGHDLIVIGVAGVYYTIILLLKKFTPIRNYADFLVVYGALPIIWYALSDEALTAMTPAFLFFLPFLAFFILGKRKGVISVVIYILGIVAVYLYDLAKPSPIYAQSDVFFSITGIIFTSVIGYVVTISRNKIANLYIEEYRKYQNYKLAVSQATNHIILTDANGKILFANEAAEKITGYSFAEMQGNTPRLWGGLQSPEFYTRLWNTIKREKKQFSGTIQNRKKSGEIYSAITHIAPILDENEQLMGFIGAEEDITKIVTLEGQLAQDKQRDEALLLSLGEGVVAQNKDGKVVLINKAAEEMLQYSAEDLIGKSFVDIVHAQNLEGETIAKEQRPLTKVGELKKPITDQLIYVRKDSSVFNSEVVISPVYVDQTYYGNVQVFKDITREKQIDKAKTEFISLASHQLRTPLSSIRWFSEILLDGDEGELTEKQKGALQNVYKSTLRMIELVTGLLNISRIESGRIMVEPEPTDINGLINDVKTDIEVKAKEKGQQITTKIEDNIPQIPLDKNLISNVFMNLISNAIKYSPNDSEICVEVCIKDNNLLCSVADHGYGIPPKQQNLVFKKFFRAENIVKVVTDGTGLGLYLVKSVIDSSGGKVWFESEEGKGTTFFFTLPITGMVRKKGEVSLDS